MKRLSFASHLSDKQYKTLLETYAKHNSSMGMEKRAQYTFSNIDKVEADEKKGHLRVYYCNGDWWYYTESGHWY